MKILVLGAGVIGTTTAWYLQKAGHEVTVLDRQPAAGLETSFANGGQISVSHAEPWASPEAPFKALQWMLQEDAPLLFRPRIDPALWQWAWQFLKECRPAQWQKNIRQLVKLGLYSRQCLAELRVETGIRYDHLGKGILHFYTSQKVFDGSARTAEVMRAAGCEREIISTAQAIQIEPALKNIAHRIVGASYTAHDESGDAHQFTQQLSQLAGERGVVFRYQTQIVGWCRQGDQLSGLRVQTGEQISTLEADAYVLACGSYSRELAQSLGIALNIYPAKGYSATFPVLQPDAVPYTSLTDDQYKIVFSRLGNRLRVAGTAEFIGFDLTINPRRCAPLVKRTRELVGDAVDYQNVEFWTGLRPSTPSNIPYIGRSQFSNLFLNTGHGTLGWTHACGSASLLADLISGKETRRLS